MSRLRRVVVIGGSGRLGRHAAARALRRSDRVVVTGLRQAHATAVARWLGPRAEATAVDVTDGTALRSVLDGADAVLNLASPYFRLGTAVLDAAIDTGCHYADACDDWETTVDLLARNDRVEAAGLIAVTGFGLAPGVDDALAGLAMEQLDEVHDLRTVWSLTNGEDDRNDPPIGPADQAATHSLTALLHLLQCCVGPIRVLEGGLLIDEEPLRPIDLLHPAYGLVRAFTVGSPEAVTLHRGRPSMRSNRNAMIAPDDIADGLRDLAAAVRSGDLDLDAAAGMLAHDPSGDGSANGSAFGAEMPSLFAIATGLLGGKPTIASVDLRHRVPQGLCAAGSLLGTFPGLLADDLLPAPGVHTVSQAVPPLSYLALVADLHESSTEPCDLVRITARPLTTGDAP